MELPDMINAGSLVLKRWEPEWAGETAAAVRESLPELKPFLPWATDDYGVAQAADFIGHSVRSWAEGTEFNYAIFTTVGELAGAIGLMTRMGPGVLEIGYWIRTPYAGRGYATTAVTVLARIAGTLPGIERVAIQHDVTNAGSAAVAIKAGFPEVARIANDTGGTDVIRERRTTP